MRRYIENLLETNNNPNKKEVFKSISPFIATNLSSKFDIRVQNISASNQITYDSDKNQINLYNNDIYKALHLYQSYIIKKVDGISYIFLSTTIFYKNTNCEIIRFILEISSSVKILNNIFMIMLLVLVISLGIGLLLIHTFAKEIITPILTLKKKTKKISISNFSDKVIILSGDEIEHLADTFNLMSDNIETYISELKEAKIKQKNFFNNISHKFKTPLTAIINFSKLFLN